MEDERFIGLLAGLLAHLRVCSDSSPTRFFKPPTIPCAIVGALTTMPRATPLYSLMRYPSIVNVVVTGITITILQQEPKYIRGRGLRSSDALLYQSSNAVYHRSASRCFAYNSTQGID